MKITGVGVLKQSDKTFNFRAYIDDLPNDQKGLTGKTIPALEEKLNEIGLKLPLNYEKELEDKITAIAGYGGIREEEKYKSKKTY